MSELLSAGIISSRKKIDYTIKIYHGEPVCVLYFYQHVNAFISYCSLSWRCSGKEALFTVTNSGNLDCDFVMEVYMVYREKRWWKHETPFRNVTTTTTMVTATVTMTRVLRKSSLTPLYAAAGFDSWTLEAFDRQETKGRAWRDGKKEKVQAAPFELRETKIDRRCIIRFEKILRTYSKKKMAIVARWKTTEISAH